MKYKDPITGELRNIIIKSGDTLPIGTIVDFDGDVIPDGYEEATEASDVVNSLEGNEIYRAPSVKTVNEVLNGVIPMGSIVVEDVTCKNLFDFIFESTTKNGITSTYADGILTLNGTATAQTDIVYSGKNFTMKANTPYTITVFYVSGTTSDNVSFYMQNSESWQGFNFNIKDQNVSLTRDETYTNNDLILNANKFIRIPSGVTLNNFKIKIQLEKGIVTTNYVKPKEFSNKQIYSTSEQVIGTWIDGKPLYRKVIDFGALPNTTSKSVAHGISNIDYIVDIRSTAALHGGDTMKLDVSDKDGLKFSVHISANNTNITVLTGSDRSGFTRCYVTLEYTKTTD